jgi:hypothetical protein
LAEHLALLNRSRKVVGRASRLPVPVGVPVPDASRRRAGRRLPCFGRRLRPEPEAVEAPVGVVDGGVVVLEQTVGAGECAQVGLAGPVARVLQDVVGSRGSAQGQLDRAVGQEADLVKMPGLGRKTRQAPGNYRRPVWCVGIGGAFRRDSIAAEDYRAPKRWRDDARARGNYTRSVWSANNLLALSRRESNLRTTTMLAAWTSSANLNCWY